MITLSCGDIVRTSIGIGRIVKADAGSVYVWLAPFQCTMQFFPSSITFIKRGSNANRHHA